MTLERENHVLYFSKVKAITSVGGKFCKKKKKKKKNVVLLHILT